MKKPALAAKKHIPVKAVVKSIPAKSAKAKMPVKAAPPAKPMAKTAIPVPLKNQGLAKPAVPAKPTPIAKTDVKKEASKTASKTTTAKIIEVAAPDASIKRPAKLFFIEVKPGAERVIKRGDKSLNNPAPIDIQARRKDTAAEETPEELGERIERELQHQSFFKRSTLKPQMCTKCGISVVVPRFTIDRELGYCDGCADILRLGATKEARRMEFNPSVKKEGDDTIVPPDEAAVAMAAAEEGDEESVPDID